MKIVVTAFAAVAMLASATLGAGVASAQPIPPGPRVSHDDPGNMVPHRGYRQPMHQHRKHCSVRTVKSWHHGHPVWKKMRVCR